MGSDPGILGPRTRGHRLTAAEWNAAVRGIEQALNLRAEFPLEVRSTAGGAVIRLARRTPLVAWGLVRAVRVSGGPPAGAASIADIRVDASTYGEGAQEDNAVLNARLLVAAALAVEVDVHPPEVGHPCVIIRKPVGPGEFTAEVWCPTAVVAFEECAPAASAASVTPETVAALAARVADLERALAAKG